MKANQADEDSFFLNHTLYKLNTVETKYDENNLMNPFNIRTIGTKLKNSQCEIIFAPHYVLIECILLGLNLPRLKERSLIMWFLTVI